MVLAISGRKNREMKHTNLKFYDQLLRLHLFQGVGKSDLAKIAGYAKIGFETIGEDEYIGKTGEEYSKLLFLTSGKAKVTTTAYDNSFTIEETVAAPYTIMPERLFGLSQTFARTIAAATKCNIMWLSKNEILKLADNILIFRLNLLNTYATMVQKKENELWRQQPARLDSRVANWITARCMEPTGRKLIYIKMTTLAGELNDSRLDISRALNSMQKAGRIILSRGKILVPHAELL